MPRAARRTATAPRQATATTPADAATAGPPPIQLTGSRLRLWQQLQNGYQLEPASLELLRNGAEALERAAQLAAQVQAEGATFRDRFGGIRPNPAAQLEQQYRALATRTLAQLAARMET